MINRFSFIFMLFLAVSSLKAQDITIINTAPTADPALPLDQLVLKRVTEQTFIIQEYEPANVGPRNQLEQMINYGIRSYIDSQYHLFDGHVQVLVSPLEFASATQAIVKNAIWIHEQDFMDEFKGFSKFTQEIASQLYTLDGLTYQVGDNEMKSADKSSIGLYTFQRKVLELKNICEFEIRDFLNEHMPYQHYSGGLIDTPPTYLDTKDYTLTEASSNSLQLEELKLDETLLFESVKPKKSKKKKDKNSDQAMFNERILALLESNNKILETYGNRFESLQNQIYAIQKNQSEPSQLVLTEIAELRNMIEALANGAEIVENNGSRTKLVPDQGLTLMYEKNAHQLNFEQMEKLRQMTRLLNQNPGYTAIITGYADRSGNKELNEWISKQRAETVKEFLSNAGIDKRRLIVNFLGDSKSIAVGPDDRKVEIKFLLNYTALH